MKVGLLTYHHTTNFGSLLQTYGLYKAVNDLGIECEVIDYHNQVIDAREAPLRIGSCRSPRDFFHYFVREPAKRRKEKIFSEFLQKEMKLSNTSYDASDISDSNEHYDLLLSGSDLVWDFSINGHDLNYMFDFAEEKKKRVAYASSAGSVWKEKEEVISHLNLFSCIAVREFQIQEILTEWLNRKIEFVCDPTMLLAPSEWMKYVGPRLIRKPYVLCYMSDPKGKIYEDARLYADRKGLEVRVLTYGKAPAHTKGVTPASVEEFLSLIMYADTVFSASYHGLLFSLYLNKNVYYYNRGWKTRMDSLAKVLGIENREQLSDANMHTSINYEVVNARMSAFRKKSLVILERALKESNNK